MQNLMEAKYWRLLVIAFALAGLLLVAVLAVSRTGEAHADPGLGTVLAGPFVPTGPTGNGRGIAFDGTDLYYTRVGDPNIYRINTAGVLQATVSVPGGDPRVSNGGPLAWDGTHLWTVDYSNTLTMYRVDPNTGATTSSCSIAGVNLGHLALAGLNFPDGLHWTGTQLVLSGEISTIGRPTAVVFMNPDCTITSFFTSPPPNDGQWSGVAFDGSTLWHSDPSATVVEQSDLAGVLSGVSFGSSGLQIEDLEFDSITFAPLCALWGNEATFGSNRITAWEIPCPVVEVEIDIKPNSDPSSFGCSAKGSLPVAVLGSADFDATEIDADTVRFGKVGNEAAEVHQKGGEARRHVEDFNNDGFLDMIFHFSLAATGFSCDDIPAGEKSADVTGNLTGELGDGTNIVGQGILRLVGK